MASSMIRQCAWCNGVWWKERFIPCEVSLAFVFKQVSHGICEECKENVLKS